MFFVIRMPETSIVKRHSDRQTLIASVTGTSITTIQYLLHRELYVDVLHITAILIQPGKADMLARIQHDPQRRMCMLTDCEQ